MTRDELIRMYCQLRCAVAEIIDEQFPDNTSRAHDCFCSSRPHKITDYQDNVFKFIRSSIAVRLEREGHGLGAKFNRRLNDINSYDKTREFEINRRGK